MKPLLVSLAVAVLLFVHPASAANSHEIVLDASGTRLNPKRYAFWAIGWSTASKKYLDMAPDNAGEWYPMRPGSGHVTAIRLGTGQGELSKIRVSSSNPIDGARLYVVVVPVDAGHQVAPPCVNYANDGASVEQPTNPGPGAGANMWFCNMRQFISQFFEITLLDNNRPMTIDVQVVDGFVYPATITLSPKPSTGPPLQVGQPLDAKGKAPTNVNRQTVFTAYKNFINKEPLTPALKTAYLELLTKSGTTAGGGRDVITNGILSPAMFLADDAASKSSALQTQYDAALQALFKPGNVIGMRSDNRQIWFKGTAMEQGGKSFIDFVAYDAAGCASPNAGYHYRVFSPLTPGGTKQGTAAFMVFANAGVFDDASPDAIIAGDVGIGKALQRDIAAALNRGMALLPAPSGATFGCNAENTLFWANEKNFYPKAGTYNNYARFAHVAKVANKLLFVAPPNAVTDAQGALMGQSYGFPYDETPGNGDQPQPNVPAKFDPVPPGTTAATITIGTFGALK